MGLFTTKKRPCAICGGPTPRLFPEEVEGNIICKECSEKVDLPEANRKALGLEGFRQCVAYYNDNQSLRDLFKESFFYACKEGEWDDGVSLDTEHGLFRLKVNKGAMILEASALKAFRILEDDYVLYESTPEGLKCYPPQTPERARAMEPEIMQFRMLTQQYDQMKEMEDMVKEQTNGKVESSTFRSMTRPTFEHRAVTDHFVIEVTLEHPYWYGVHTRSNGSARFSEYAPDVGTFLRDYDKQMDKLHELAWHLMGFINPEAQEILIQPETPAGDAPAAGAAASADPVAEIQRYKALLDAGAITEEEFTAKKRQLMGI